jgi:hypothetical protein
MTKMLDSQRGDLVRLVLFVVGVLVTLGWLALYMD